MDVFTAGIALSVVQVCVALVMACLFWIMPTERCARNWALSAACIAGGVLAVILNAGAPRYAILLLGNGAIILGMVLQLEGVRSFHEKPTGYVGWVVGTIFIALFAWLLMKGIPSSGRALLVAACVLVMLVLTLIELWTGKKGSPRRFANMVTLVGVGFLALCYLTNVTVSALQLADFSITTTSPLAITLIYLVPVGGTLLLSTGFLLLLFERVVNDKENLAMHDELTGVLNRRAIEIGATREVGVALRTGGPLAVAYVDIDFFKQINDRLGHGVGDTILVQAAQVLQKTCRSIDLVGRYGGDEFCIVLPGLDADNASAFGERLVGAFRQQEFAMEGEVTVSVGLASCSGDSCDCTWSTLTRQADRALYDAKAAGRDRFCVIDHPASRPSGPHSGCDEYAATGQTSLSA